MSADIIDSLDFDFYAMPLAPITGRQTVTVRIDNGRLVSANVERHSSGLVFISDAGGADLGPVDARRVIESAIRDAQRSVPAEWHGGVQYLASGPQIEDGRTFAASIARALKGKTCAFALE